MAIAAFGRDPHRPYRASGVVAVTGSLVVKLPFQKGRAIQNCQVSLIDSDITGSNESQVTWQDNGDGTITVYVWKISAGVFAAGSAAQNVMVVVDMR